MKLPLPLACTIALLAPVCLATAGLAWVAVGERVGARPFAGLVPENSAEAAALGDAGDLMRFLHGGENPRQVYSVRAEVISSAVLRATTYEAAMWAREASMIRLLDREAGAGGHEERRELACLAADLEIEEVVEYLSPEGTASCEPGDAIARLLARTSGAEGER